MGISATIKGRREVFLSGITSHIVAEVLTKDIRDILLSKGRTMNVFFEGGPGPLGEGMAIRIVLNEELTDYEVRTLKKFFEIRGITCDVV